MSLQQLQEKWAPVLNHEALPEIEDSHKRGVVAQLLENQEKAQVEESRMLSETLQTTGYTGGDTATGATAGFDPVLISLIRRSMPQLIAYDIAGVQPMTGPTGLIFAMRTNYGSERRPAESGYDEAFFNEPNAGFSGGGGTSYDPGATNANNDAQGTNPGLLNDSPAGTYEQADDATGMTTATVEGLDDATSGSEFREMGFSIEKVTVTARARALKAEYSLELAQDLKAIHGLDAEQELSNILSTEILAEINREVVRTIYTNAVAGAQNNTANAGIFDLDVDSNGRWSVEKFKGLLFQIERDANAIGQQTRRGKGNILICSADVASALGMAGVLDYTPALAGNNGLTGVDDTSSTLVGTLNGRIKVYVDPYSANVADKHFYVAGYKGTSPYDAGLFYCPYVPLQQVRAINPNTFQPKIGFKTRYGMVSNPFSGGLTQGSGALTANANKYYRRVQVANLM
ncbi:major capsid protein [Synechococcus phage S-CAM22]|uniref:Major capsid protein n=1 Tax=Synechococcus phage S-CAM22 TaxID=1883365 RepID=A0A1D8KRP2_9CAUD|nr:major head protein [Synechococcus phage S-CAM22]YP_010088771.1 major head protein [Synechococcus phage S-CAM22]AOV60942.1 major capsid protein [Synechococcus phage S-CAM22]AOV61156.1 major capsid protein [Synechococcus phage S-CAM22]AOV61370.1 major capsid protein [Synechococcus phage S-CAM22]